MRVKLSSAQIDALECRGLEDAQYPEDLLVARCLECGEGVALIFDQDNQDDLFSALVEMSNAEDAFSEMSEHDRSSRTFAGRAARSLGAIAGRVLRAKKTLGALK